ncbi:hypothetical protein F5882DRAFT_480944 [Hyaloscypha sp. PMI_1271]|nr:hypothetical protein F5882DRAFT_480944 [Hyaloscypha sp. PMI_1271]
MCSLLFPTAVTQVVCGWRREGGREGGREEGGREKGRRRKSKSRSGSVPEYHWPKELLAAKLDYYCAPSCSVLTALGQGNQSVQALPGRAGSFLESVAPRQRQPKTTTAMQRAAGLVSGSSGSCGSRQEEWRAVWEAWAAWAAWAERAEWAVEGRFPKRLTALMTGLTAGLTAGLTLLPEVTP